MSLFKRNLVHTTVVALLASVMSVTPWAGYDSQTASAAVNDGNCELIGFGTSAYPYLVDSPEDFEEIVDCDGSGVYFEQRTDIDFGNTWSSIPTLQGHYDGNFKLLQNLTFNNASTNDVAPFGLVRTGASIRRVTLHTVTITAGQRVGGLATDIEKNAFVSQIRIIDPRIIGSDYVGALASSTSGTIGDVVISGGYARTGFVQSPGHVGGVVSTIRVSASNDEVISTSYMNAVSISNFTIDHTAGNSNTRMGGIAALVSTGLRPRVIISDVAIDATLDDTSTGTQAGMLFGSHFQGDAGTLDLSVNGAVLSIVHEVANPSSSRLLSLLGNVLTDVEASVQNVAVSALSYSNTITNTQSVELLGGQLYSNTTVTADAVYFDTTVMAADKFTYTTGATAKTANELTENSLYTSWPTPASVEAGLFQPNPLNSWVKDGSSRPWLANAASLGLGPDRYRNIRISSLGYISKNTQLGHIALVGHSSANYTLAIDATLPDTTPVNILNGFDGKASGHTYVGTQLKLFGTLAEIDSDLKRLVLDPTIQAAAVNLSFVLEDTTPAQIYSENIEFTYLGCSLQGDGSAESPYLVSSELDLQRIMACDDVETHFEQTADIDLDFPHVPIGNNAARFQGSYDGGGYTISGLRNHNPLGWEQGLFGATGDSGGTSTATEIKNLTVRGEVTGDNQVAILVGDVDDLNVQNVNLFGTVNAVAAGGLLTGDAEDFKVVGVVAEGRVSVIEDEAALIVGDANDNDIWLEDITLRGQVVGNRQIGGLAGLLGSDNEQGLVRQVQAFVDIVSVDDSNYFQDRVGGLAGDSARMSFSDVTVRGLTVGGRTGRVFVHADLTDPDQSKTRVGGLLGRSIFDVIRDADVQIDVIAQSPQLPPQVVEFGGLIGYAKSIELSDSSYSGNVSALDATGGAIGALFDGPTIVSNLVIDADVTSAGADVGGFAGRTMHDEGTLVLEDISVSGDINASGNGPFGGLIGDINRNFDANTTVSTSATGTISIFRTTTNVDITVVGVATAGGLIGAADVVSELLIQDSSTSGSILGGGTAGGFIGGLSSGQDADSQVTIQRSFATGSVDAPNSEDSGGFIGYSDSSSSGLSVSIQKSFATGDVTGDDGVGGFIGFMQRTAIEDSYSTGDVLGTANVGGFVGDMDAVSTITDSYVAGNVGYSAGGSGAIGRFAAVATTNRLANNGWNSAISTPPGGAIEGAEFEISPANINTLSTFAGWSITDTLAGDEETWVICPALSTLGPILWHQVRAAGGDCGDSQLPDLAQSISVEGASLDFEYPLDIGWFSSVGYAKKYRDIVNGSAVPIDATVSVHNAVGIDSFGCNNGYDSPNNLLSELDDTDAGAFNRFISVEMDDLCTQNRGEAYVELKVAFSSYSQPITLENIVLDISDVDDYQFVELSNFDRFKFAEGTILSPSIVNGVTRVSETQGLQTSPTNTTADFNFVGSAFTVGRVQFEIEEARELIIKLGATENGAAYFDLDFSFGENWQDARGAAVVLTQINPVIEAANAAPAPYVGPVVYRAEPQNISNLGGLVELVGENLESVTKVVIGETELELQSVTSKVILAEVPAGLTLGLKDAKVTSDFGVLLVADLIRIVSEDDLSFHAWTSLKGDYVKVYAKNLVGKGKVQFVVNGKEIAWVRAADASNPKIREANGFKYMVRSVTLRPGKNVFEIYLGGTRVKRVAYSG